MKKLRRLAFFAMLAATVGAAFVSPAEAQQRVLRVTGTGANPPYNFIDPATNTQTGIAVEIADAVAADLGMTTAYGPVMSVADMPAALMGGAIDVYAGNLTITDARLAQFQMSIPFHLNIGDRVWVLKSDTTDYQSILDFRGQVVGALRGSNYIPPLEALGPGTFAEIRQYEFTSDIARAVISGEIKAGVITGVTGFYAISEGIYPELHVPANYRGSMNVGGLYALPIGRDAADIYDAFNRSLGKLMIDGTVTEIFAKYGLDWPARN